VVFCGLFPVDAADFEELRGAMGKLRLNDASFSFDGDLGRARLRLPLRLPRAAAPRDHPGAPEREFNLNLIATAPSVVYQIVADRRHEIELHNPADMPDVVKIEEIASRGSRRRSSRPTNISARC
jgi:GTP-binding protein LepA